MTETHVRATQGTADSSTWRVTHHRRSHSDRLYVTDGEQNPLGWCDLESGDVVAVVPGIRSELLEFLRAWLASDEAAALGRVPDLHDPALHRVVTARRRPAGEPSPGPSGASASEPPEGSGPGADRPTGSARRRGVLRRVRRGWGALVRPARNRLSAIGRLTRRRPWRRSVD